MSETKGEYKTDVKLCPFCGKPFEIVVYQDDGSAFWLHDSPDCPMHRDGSGNGWIYENADGLREELNQRAPQPSRADAEVINGLRLKVEELEKRAEMHARINREVAEALGLPTGESWHDLGERVEKMHDALEKLAGWQDAYPLDVFPEPDMIKARKLLSDSDVLLGDIFAANARFVTKRMVEIAREALK